MSRHRKVKALDYDQEYDDYYGDFDDDEDLDDGAFEAQYLSSGIDLNASDSKSNNTSNANKSRQTIFAEPAEANANQSSLFIDDGSTLPAGSSSINNLVDSDKTTTPSVDHDKTATILDPGASSAVHLDMVTSDLTRIAIQHLDKHQWQLPLMEMDKKFRDKTYYKHFSDTYISSLRSKLGHFLTDNQLIDNPMRYHLQKENDNFSKYSRMFEPLIEYYKSLGGGFFSFATPSPDEEIIIGCRQGTKVKTPAAKQKQAANNKTDADQKTARFEYHGKASKSTNPSASKANARAAAGTPKTSDPQQPSHDIFIRRPNRTRHELTIQENFTARQLDELAKKYQSSVNIETTADRVASSKNLSVKIDTGSSSKQTAAAAAAVATVVKKKTTSRQPAKQLVTLEEKRQNLKQQLKRNNEPTPQDIEAFKRQALQTAHEYRELAKNSRPRVNLVVVGHVDAGKSTLVGHLLYNLGQISGKQMHRYEVDSQRSGKASFKFAWAMDETAEERARGVTIDIALTQFATPHRDVVLLDAPGHVDFIPAVISGAAQADAALLVVDATRGEFETGFNAGGQTREHTFLVRSLGVKSLIVIVNKMDSVDWNWSRYVDIVEQLKPFLKQVGFNLRDDVQFIACSGLTGENISERRIDKVKRESSHPQLEGEGGNWGALPSLLEAIDKITPPERMVDKPTRVCVTDVFKGMSSGVFLGAKVVAGKIESKQRLVLLPPNESCDVKQVEVRDTKANKAFAGDIVTTVTTGIELNKFYRGCILCDPLIPCHVTNRFQARIVMFQSINTILIKGTPIEVHINGTHESGVVRKLISLLNKSTGELVQRRPRCVAKNASAIIQLRLSRVVCCELYEDNKDLGRFMLRSCGKTIAAGLITKIKRAKVEKGAGTKLKFK